MTEIIQQQVTGVVKFYKFEEGWGFIDTGTGDSQFFHRSNLKCSPPYEGEEVTFDITPSRSPDYKHEAVNVRRPQHATMSGDVLNWRVEPGTWRTYGTIEPHDGGDALPFSLRDFKPSPTGPDPKPRPWHAATFTIVQTGSGPKVVDIELDTRYPLYRFAYLGPDEDTVVAQLKQMAIPERWDYPSSTPSRESPILYNYLHFTFARLRDEDRKLPDDQKKVQIRADLPEPLAAFNTGLVDRKYKSIYALFEANQAGRKPAWQFRAFCIPGERHGQLLAANFSPLPRPPQYFTSTNELLYDPDAPLYPDYEHIFGRNRERLPRELLGQLKNMSDSIGIRFLTMHLDAAIDVAKKRARWNYRTAIPHYFPTFKRLDLLLPLSLVSDDRVDLALSVEKVDKGYLGHTILPLDWAYRSARLVCRPDSDWLSPEQISETPQGFEIDDA